MYHVETAYLLRVGLGIRMFYKAISWMIHPELRARFVLSGESDPAQLKNNFHPSQLEKRFGGTADTPVGRFWPPVMGPDYLPEGDDSHLEKIEDYE